MSGSWFVHEVAGTTTLPLSAVAQLLQAAQADDDAAPAAPMLHFVNRLATVDYLMLARYEPERGAGPPRAAAPVLLQGPEREPQPHRSVTADCFGIYCRAFWRSDANTTLAGEMLAAARPEASPIVVRHQRAVDIPVPAWRHEIYEREHLADRLSLLYALRPREVFAINLYRDDRAGRFRPAEVQALLGVATLLREVHRAALGRANLGGQPGALGPEADASGTDRRLPGRGEMTLARHVPALSPRERQVLARIALGTGADGIAADLGIAPSSVATLRKRGYAKLAEAGHYGGRLALARWLTRGLS